MAGRGSADRAADLSGSVGPVPVARLVEPGARIRAWPWPVTRPRPSGTQPPALAPLTGLVVRRWGASRSWRPAFAKGMFSPVEATRGEPIIGNSGQ